MSFSTISGPKKNNRTASSSPSATRPPLDSSPVPLMDIRDSTGSGTGRTPGLRPAAPLPRAFSTTSDGPPSHLGHLAAIWDSLKPAQQAAMQRVSLHDVEEGLARARVSTHDIARTASDRHAIELATAEREGLAAPLRAQLTTLHRHSPTAGRSVALRIPCVMGRVGVVKALLADGIDPSPSASAKDSESRKPSAFEMAAKRGHVGVMRVLLQHHARGAWAECGDSAGGIDNVLRTVMGSPNNTADVIDFLVNEAGADVDARNDHGDTLLHEAVLWDSLEATVALLRHGADVEAVNDKGYTPLLIAAGFGKQSVFEALAEAGANIHHRASNGWSVLDITVIAGNLETLGALVRRKVDVRAIGPSATGSSSLHWAAINNKKAAIDALIAAGADVNTKTAVGGQT
ncbi:unnamed protein product, partial [Ascophyllum nodosum]